VPLFGPVHLSLLLATIGAAIALSRLCRRKQVSGRAVRLALGCGLAGNELIWWVFRYSHEGVHVSNLPLQLCDLTVWMTVLASLTTVPVIVEFTYFAGVAGSGMALLTPDLWTPWPSYPAIYFFIAHGGVLVACAVLTFGKLAQIRRGAVWRAFGVLAAYALAIGAFNAIFATNYMYLCKKPANPSLLDLLGPWPVYLGGGAVVACMLFWVLWLPLRPAARDSGQAAEDQGR
jgi:hypothetical integral membrane protein (TIGR02206 family)